MLCWPQLKLKMGTLNQYADSLCHKHYSLWVFNRIPLSRIQVLRVKIKSRNSEMTVILSPQCRRRTYEDGLYYLCMFVTKKVVCCRGSQTEPSSRCPGGFDKTQIPKALLHSFWVSSSDVTTNLDFSHICRWSTLWRPLAYWLKTEPNQPNCQVQTKASSWASYLNFPCLISILM